MKLNRLVKWIGDIDEKNFDRVYGEIVKLHQENSEEPTVLLLSSKGGDTSVGFAFYDIIQALKPKLLIVGTGIVGSITPIVLASGQARFLTENTKLSFHNFFVRGNDTLINLEPQMLIRLGNEMKKDVERYCRILATRSGGLLSSQKMKGIIAREATLTATEAVRLGFADAVLNPDDMKI